MSELLPPEIGGPSLNLSKFPVNFPVSSLNLERSTVAAPVNGIVTNFGL
jgi:hypothetical protein